MTFNVHAKITRQRALTFSIFDYARTPAYFALSYCSTAASFVRTKRMKLEFRTLTHFTPTGYYASTLYEHLAYTMPCSGEAMDKPIFYPS